jgi:MFS transporter, CP family, cyanate transporter
VTKIIITRNAASMIGPKTRNALPPFLSLPADVPRTAAGMFTISYTCAIIIPTICGALWDLTGKPWTAFVPLCLCAVALAVLGTVVTRRSPAVQAAHG